MALDRNKTLQSAETLLKQGKVQAALTEFRRLAEAAPSDMVVQNRLGDLCAREGRNEEAIVCYQRIAAAFTEAGFLPKAVAIHKKILRLDAKRSSSLLDLGELYLKQKLPGEGRHYMLDAAKLRLAAADYAGAREVYERLVAAEPDDPRHRVRLAETRAAEGDPERAGRELIEVAARLFEIGNPAAAETSYRRAGELLPGQPGPLLGLARCLQEQGRPEEALPLLRRGAAAAASNPVALGEVLLSFDAGGHASDLEQLLAQPTAADIAPETFVTLVDRHLTLGKVDALWPALDRAIDAWTRHGRRNAARRILETLAELEPDGHAPALRRLYELDRTAGDLAAVAQTLDRLVRAYRACSMEQEASRMLEQLRAVAPQPPPPSEP
ncbi:MAG TPA: tetratricopeptide repeat protein, partial [Candidatus Polarisedimenticolaceae bacterium]|nr:tetratricopeptide repeat protein [Candidatus Polarisedimenticolaceae bacterium]